MMKEIPITTNTIKKIKSYARLMGRRECYGILLSPRDSNDRMVYNAILAVNQRVFGASAGINEEAAAATKAEIENLGYNSLGFWHSHAGMNAWHSHVDDGNLESLLLDFAGNTERITEKERATKGYNFHLTSSGLCITVPFGKKLLEVRAARTRKGSNFTIRKSDKDIPNGITYDSDRKILSIVNNREVLTLMEVGYPDFKPVPIRKEKISGEGVAYSIVVNNGGEVYGELAIAKWCYLCGGIETRKVKDVVLKPIEVKEDIQFSEEELMEEIKKKVR